MQDPIREFGNEVRKKRILKKLSQKQLAETLGMSYRTVLDVEKGSGDRKFETVIMLARELEISLDSLIFPDSTVSTSMPQCVFDFFEGKPEKEARKFITLCHVAETLCDNK